MPKASVTEVPTLYKKIRKTRHPYKGGASSAPREIQATLHFGEGVVFVLAPETKTHSDDNTLDVNLVGEVGNYCLVSFPGIVENAGSTIKVKKTDIELGTS